VLTECRQEAQLAQIAHEIGARASESASRVRVVAISGPTSSGKTTFSHKLAHYLRVCCAVQSLLFGVPALSPRGSAACVVYSVLSRQNHGIEGKPLSVDHYYLPLDRQPKYQVGAQDSRRTDRPPNANVRLIRSDLFHSG
jgi:hypothetical protein